MYELIEGFVLCVTEKAVLLRPLNSNDDVWIPKSVIHEDDRDRIEHGEDQEFDVKSWFARKEGLV